MDEVEHRTIRGRGESPARARYHFTTPQGQLIDATAPLDAIDAAAFSRGSAVEVLYDPEQPTRNAMVSELWAVTWKEAETITQVTER